MDIGIVLLFIAGCVVSFIIGGRVAIVLLKNKMRRLRARVSDDAAKRGGWKDPGV